MKLYELWRRNAVESYNGKYYSLLVIQNFRNKLSFVGMTVINFYFADFLHHGFFTKNWTPIQGCAIISIDIESIIVDYQRR